MATRTVSRSRLLTPTLALLWLACIPATASSRALWTTNYGVDSSTCGYGSYPCRSISQAIDNADTGDTIWVGAGRYGDLNGDGDFDDPGDEHASDCVVCISKEVQVYSVNGAEVTIIEGNASVGEIVAIRHSGVRFGAMGHGFTLKGTATGLGISFNGDFGYHSRQHGAGGYAAIINTKIYVVGNVSLNGRIGFLFNGPSWSPLCGSCNQVSDGYVLFWGNQSIGNDVGFLVAANSYKGPGRIVLQDNLALDSGTGFLITSGWKGDYFLLADGAFMAELTHNVASHGKVGFVTALAKIVQDNVASDNSEVGFMLVPGDNKDTAFRRNSAIGNAGPGAIVATLDRQPRRALFRNNFFGNDRDRPSLSLSQLLEPLPPTSPPTTLNAGPSAHCGVLNVGLVPSNPYYPLPPPLPIATLEAANNFWGSVSGPQPNGAGDAAAGVCDQNGGVTLAGAFASAPFPIIPMP